MREFFEVLNVYPWTSILIALFILTLWVSLLEPKP